MKRAVIALLAISICFGGDNLPHQLEQIKEALQKKYQVYSLDDLHKLKNLSQPSHRTAPRDMEDLAGDWMMEEEIIELFVTVGTDKVFQTHLRWWDLRKLMEASLRLQVIMKQS